ncbi:MAG: Ppx/GppA family phosphatase [Sphingomonadales bacterium]|nr:Ppx/GppA family phosphatase [Sphingomonadales bacterium]MBD3772980.1 Ppx/GppA family phosphatase [Paracoccaceae bacterium]
MPLRTSRHDRDGNLSGTKAERAIIDIGSNTVRMVVYGGSLRAPTVLLNEKVAARLGRDISSTGLLAGEAVDMAMRGLRRFARLLRELGVRDVETVATAAVRDAANGAEFLTRVAELGLAPRLLSGEEEACASAMGVIGAFPGARGVVADMGGGSLEFTRIADGQCSHGVSLPIGSLRLHELREGKPSATRKAIVQQLKAADWADPIAAPLYLVGGTWRTLAVYAMQRRGYALTDPHGYTMSPEEAMEVAAELVTADPEKLRQVPRISSMRAAILPDAAILLQALVERLQPEQLVISAWGLREGILFSRLDPLAQAQDPLLAGLSLFAAQRGAPPTLAIRVAGWTVDAVPPNGRGSERMRLAATMLALASMQTEPNLRIHQGIDWALHKRWIDLTPQGRAMLAATLSANANQCELPDEVQSLADGECLEEAICWGLAIRLCRRLGAQSRRSHHGSRLSREDGVLLLELEEDLADLYGVPNQKDMKLLANRLGLEPQMRVVPVDSLRSLPEFEPVPSEV